VKRYESEKLWSMGPVDGFLIHTPDDRKLRDTHPQTIVRELNRMADRIKRLEDVLQTAWFLMANVNWKRKKDPDMYKDFVNWRDNDFLPVMRWQKRKDTKAKEAKQ
jgi:hypothetical protein